MAGSTASTVNVALDEFRAGLVIQYRVVQAIFLRETRTRFGRQKLGYLWAFLEPALFIATFFVAFRIGNRPMPLGMSMVTFIATGLVPFQMFRSVVGRSMTAAAANKALLTYPQVRHLDLHIARFALEMVTFSVIFSVIMVGYEVLYADAIARPDLLSVLGGFAACGLLGFGVGLLFSGGAVFFPMLERLQSSILRPLFWVSGVFFNANDLPIAARELLLWNPVLHGVELIRGGWFESYEAVHASPGYLLTWIVVSLALGLYVERLASVRLDG